MDEIKKYIDKITAGESRYFSFFVEKYTRIAFTLSYRMVKNRETAEDLTQESFIKLYKNLAAFNYSVQFSTWFYRIVYNTCIDYLRKVNSDYSTIDIDTLDGEYSDGDDSVDFDYDYKKEMIKQALSELKGDYGFILTLYYLEELDIKEISSITGHTRESVKVKLHRGRKLLEENLKSKMKNEINEMVQI